MTEKGIIKQELPLLPFTYERTYDLIKAVDWEWRRSPVSIVGQENRPRIDSEILAMIKERREQRDWFVTEHWRKKEQPIEQIEFIIDGSPITVYNWNKEQSFTDEHMQKTKEVLEELGSRFPKVLNSLRWVLIEDYQESSLLGDPIKYPVNGQAMDKWNAFRLFPKGMSFASNRMPPLPNFTCTLIHELSHLMEAEFEVEWRENFQWRFCADYPDEWESKPSPDGNGKRFFNKRTGEMSPQDRFPCEMEQCVTDYAKQTQGEDICESITAYILKPELLQRVSPKKFEILEGKDAKKEKPKVSARRISKDEIKLPEIKPETVYYFIKEPQS